MIGMNAVCLHVSKDGQTIVKTTSFLQSNGIVSGSLEDIAMEFSERFLLIVSFRRRSWSLVVPKAR